MFSANTEPPTVLTIRSAPCCAGRVHHRRREVGRARAQADVEAEGLEQRQLVRRSRGADDLRAQHASQLQRGDADARRHAVDQKPFAGLEPALQHQHVEGHEERRAGCWRPLPTTGWPASPWPRLASISAYSENAPAQRPMTRSPGLKPATLVADRDDLASAFSADSLPAAGLAVQAMAQHELAAVQRGGMHAHQQLARARLRDAACRADRARSPCRSSASSRTASFSFQCPVKTRLRFCMRALRLRPIVIVVGYHNASLKSILLYRSILLICARSQVDARPCASSGISYYRFRCGANPRAIVMIGKRSP